VYVINLRLKGNGIFWCPSNSEGILHLRAQLLSGRWHDFVREVLQPTAFWSLANAAEPAVEQAA